MSSRPQYTVCSGITILVDCEQSLFFFRFSKGSARAKRGRQPEKKKCLSHLAPSVTRAAICVSRVLLDGLQKKESLLVVYHTGHFEVGQCSVGLFWGRCSFFYWL